MLAQQILNGIVTGSIYALFALGFTLVFGINSILNFARGIEKTISFYRHCVAAR